VCIFLEIIFHIHNFNVVLVPYFIVCFLSQEVKELLIIYFTPFLEIPLLMFQFSIFSANLISKPEHWKKTIKILK
jgi:hypothetical protein